MIIKTESFENAFHFFVCRKHYSRPNPIYKCSYKSKQRSELQWHDHSLRGALQMTAIYENKKKEKVSLGHVVAIPYLLLAI